MKNLKKSKSYDNKNNIKDNKIYKKLEKFVIFSYIYIIMN
ncbi:hypothetical protein QGO_2501 [Clostridioides difficile CD212]|nr:hypothetical protein QCC_2485 [Clostridioides difficile CD41]EQE91766.1 hypothetical protein QE9_1945 [Clostridioides difficile CD104]EQF68679.1 hypothetical protein QGK_1945 [Clostridioides difficile CD206]EQF69280.1 hypothetical protein QGG_1902 [Clostridioides difficile CD201]EQF74895.1 hypothetical protein QGO_2501 [Clostridioides difficile CD212]CCL80151.1 hypothetical protein BN187_1940006 [Clostridioides difficile E12]